MIQGVLKKIFGSRNDRLLKQYGRTVREINALEPEISRLSDEALRAKTDEFRRRIQERVAAAARKAEEKASSADSAEASSNAEEEDTTATAAAPGQDTAIDRVRREALEEILPEAFAVVREAGKRVLDMRHFDMQLVGGIALHNGKISEMGTGGWSWILSDMKTVLETGRSM